MPAEIASCVPEQPKVMLMSLEKFKRELQVMRTEKKSYEVRLSLGIKWRLSGKKGTKEVHWQGKDR